MPVNTIILSDQTTVFSNVSLSPGSTSAGLPPGGMLAAVTISTQTLSLATVSFSILTATAATSIPNNSLGLVFRASGLSFVYVSGGTVYSLASSTVSGVA